MNSKKLLVIGTLALIVLIAGAAALYSSFSGMGHSPVPASANASSGQSQGSAGDDLQPAPDFTVLDRDGNQVRLSDLRGKPVVLSFWASWCGICKTGMSDFEEVYADTGEEIHFMMVNLTPPAAKPRKLPPAISMRTAIRSPSTWTRRWKPPAPLA